MIVDGLGEYREAEDWKATAAKESRRKASSGASRR